MPTLRRRTSRTPAGKRDKRIEMQQLTQSMGASGFPVDTWAPLATLDAFREDINGDERFDASMLVASGHTLWETEYRADLDPDEIDVPKKRRIVFKTRVYDIVSAHHLGRHDGIEFITLGKTA